MEGDGTAQRAPAMPSPAPGSLEAQSPTAPAAMPSPGTMMPKPGTTATGESSSRIAELEAALAEERNRRAGLDRQNRGYDARFAEMEKTLGNLTEALQGLTKQEPQPPAEPPKTKQEDPRDEVLAELRAELATLRSAREAEQSAHARDALIAEYTAEGAPGFGMDLGPFKGAIPLPEGGDETASRSAIEGIIAGLRGIKSSAVKDTQAAMLQGATPGSSPAGPVAGEEAEVQEFKDLHALLNDYGRLSALSESEVAKKTARYDELLPKYGVKHVPGFRPPWGNVSDYGRDMQQLWAEFESLRTQLASGQQPVSH